MTEDEEAKSWRFWYGEREDELRQWYYEQEILMEDEANESSDQTS